MFNNRKGAGKLLAEKLVQYKNMKDVLVLAIPRGGLETGYAIAKELNIKLDMILTKKIGHPSNPEYAIGSVSLKSQVVNPEHSDVPQDYIDHEIKKIKQALKESYQKYLGNQEPTSLTNKTIIITDDGVATGSTILAALDLVRQEGVKKIIVAVPVGPADTIDRFKKEADEVVCLLVPEPFFAISQFYQDFSQVEDAEAIKLLKEANQ